MAKKTYYDRENLEIEVYTGDSWYPVDVERLTGSAPVLDFIFQIAGKGWCTPQILSDFIACVEEACLDRFGRTGQGVFCSLEQDHKVNWKTRTSVPRWR